MTADDARALAEAELAKWPTDALWAGVYSRRALAYATLALSLDEIVTVVAEPPDGLVRRLLDLSTAHLPQKTCNYLSEFEGVIAYPKRTETADFGWWLWVPEDPQEHASTYHYPAAILTIQLYARSLGCDWVMFDRDADAIDELPRWEW